MRLLHVTQSYYPFLEKGGPTVKVRALARGMASASHAVTVLTADLGFDSGKREITGAVPGRWGCEAREEGVEAIYLRTRARYRSLTWNPGVASFCRVRLRGFDLTHIYGLYDLLGPQVARACRRIARPYIVEPMGMFLPIVRSIWMKRLYHDAFGGRLLEGASRVVATSERERQEFLEGGIEEAKIVVRRNGIEIPGQFPPAGLFRNQWNIAKDAKLVLFLGRLVSKKSPDLMLEAFSHWTRLKSGPRSSVLVMAGPDEGDGLRQHLEEIAAQMGLNGSVLFTGPLYGDAKWSAYRDADVFVLPSQNENFGNTAAEAVACGTPVLVTDRCGIAPIVDQRAGLVVAHDCAALEEGLARILDDPALAARLRGGCKGVANSLSWAEPLAQMETLYRELVSERRGQ
ncbi:MAG TPA: glycosyltransferase [Candidatus Acidoferrales bacterium]|jgi:glycosyltransferase involved in cell wall biosynthesis|nr:glycosyltransferase [Candidatus Acidoferrales bacterium]